MSVHRTIGPLVEKYKSDVHCFSSDVHQFSSRENVSVVANL